MTGIEGPPTGTRGLEGLPALEVGDDGHDDGEKVLEAGIEWRSSKEGIQSAPEKVYQKLDKMLRIKKENDLRRLEFYTRNQSSLIEVAQYGNVQKAISNLDVVA